MRWSKASVVAVGAFSAALLVWLTWPVPRSRFNEDAVTRYLGSRPNEPLIEALRNHTGYPEAWLGLRQKEKDLLATVPDCLNNQRIELSDRDYDRGMRVVKETVVTVRAASWKPIAAMRSEEVRLIREILALVSVLGCLGNAAVARADGESLSRVLGLLKSLTISAARGPLGGELASRNGLTEHRRLVAAGRTAGMNVGSVLEPENLPTLAEVLQLDRLRLLAWIVESIQLCDIGPAPTVCDLDVNETVAEINAYFDRAVRACHSCRVAHEHACASAGRKLQNGEYTRLQLLMYSPRKRLQLLSRALGRALLASASIEARVAACHYRVGS